MSRAPKVILFVQRGGARPSCEGVAWREAFDRRSQERHNLGGTGFYGTCSATRAMCTADRWWLVECDNAEDGRATIAEREYLMHGGQEVPATSGSILAHGSREPREDRK